MAIQALLKTLQKPVRLQKTVDYMRDYISDEKGQIARVNFDFVEEK